MINININISYCDITKIIFAQWDIVKVMYINKGRVHASYSK